MWVNGIWEPRDTAPEDHGFQRNIAGCHWGNPMQGYFSPWGIPNLEEGNPGEYLTDRLTDEAIKLISEHCDEPFFLYFAHYAVHTPIQAPSTLVEKYRAKARDLGVDEICPFEEGEYFPVEHKKELRITRRRMQSDPVYAAMVENLDTNIGRLLNSLSEAEIADNTIVIFTSDNGGLATAEGSPTCNAPLAEGKGWMYEGGVREPLLVRWPGIIAPGSRCETPVSSPDFYPTLLEAAGVPLPPELHLDGVSMLLSLWQGGEIESRPLFWHYPHYGNQGGTPGSSVRDGDYKLLEFFEDGRLELYDLRNDIGETHNLAAEMPAECRRLHYMLLAWREKVAAKIPQPIP